MSSGASTSFWTIIWLTFLTADSRGTSVPRLSMTEMNAWRCLGRGRGGRGGGGGGGGAFRSSRSPRARRGMARLTVSGSAPSILHAWSISLKKLIFVALNRLAVYLIISEVSGLHRIMGDLSEE